MSAVLKNRQFGARVHPEERSVHALARDGIDMERCVIDALLFQSQSHSLAVQRVRMVM